VTKKDYIAIAKDLISTKPQPLAFHPSKDYASALRQWELMRDVLCVTCEQSNSRFNRKRWLGFIAGDNGPNGGSV
jgi:hypothetical protein